MKRLIFAVLVVCFCHAGLIAQTGATAEEYAVYAGVLRDIDRKNRRETKIKTSFVIFDKTVKPEEFDKSESPKMKGLIKDFREKNEISAKLTRRFPVNFSYGIVSQSELNKLLISGSKNLDESKTENKVRNTKFGNEIPWKGFYEQFPKANGYYLFSRVGFSANKKFALVYAERAEFHSGDFTKYILRKVRGKWKIYSASGTGWNE